MSRDVEIDAAVRRLLRADKPPQPEPVDRFRNWLAGLLVASFIASLPLLIWKTIPDGNKEIITYILGQISGMALTVVSFYFVSKANEAAQERQRAEAEQRRTETTSKAFDAIVAVAPTPSDQASGKPNDPVHTIEDTSS